MKTLSGYFIITLVILLSILPKGTIDFLQAEILDVTVQGWLFFLGPALLLCAVWLITSSDETPTERNRK